MQDSTRAIAPDLSDDREHIAKLAEAALQKALDNLHANVDAGADISLAAKAHDILMGYAPASDLAEYRVTEDGLNYEFVTDRECICPPELVARGGSRGGCPVHHA